MNPFLAGLGARFFVKAGIRQVKYWVDSWFRDQVVPVEGSVLYSNLFAAAEHSGIYTGPHEIVNLEVDDFINSKSKVRGCSPGSFTSGSVLRKKIYVSCDKYGPVGNAHVSRYAAASVGRNIKYNLFYRNCHVFSKECVDKSLDYNSDPGWMEGDLLSDTWEVTIGELKGAARRKVGATKWKLWDWSGEKEQVDQPDTRSLINQYREMPLTPEVISELRGELEETRQYLDEISDENIPRDALRVLEAYRQDLQEINDTIDSAEGFLRGPGKGCSIQDLQAFPASQLDQLAQELGSNQEITQFLQKMGRQYISKEKKKSHTVRKRDEIHGITQGDDITRLLPSELIYLEVEELEYLFYARLYEKSLLNYELSGDPESEQNKSKGPIIACLDTSGSMSDRTQVKSQAMLLALTNILSKEKRDLHILLFGGQGQVRELKTTSSSGVPEVMRFLGQGFNGGTDFETPLARAMEIIRDERKYRSADVLMITDGACDLSDGFTERLVDEKAKLEFSVYTVLCHSPSSVAGYSDQFSDQFIAI